MITMKSNIKIVENYLKSITGEKTLRPLEHNYGDDDLGTSFIYEVYIKRDDVLTNIMMECFTDNDVMTTVIVDDETVFTSTDKVTSENSELFITLSRILKNNGVFLVV